MKKQYFKINFNEIIDYLIYFKKLKIYKNDKNIGDISIINEDGIIEITMKIENIDLGSQLELEQYQNQLTISFYFKEDFHKWLDEYTEKLIIENITFKIRKDEKENYERYCKKHH